ncbi:MAG TPA: lanthionine synthetase C family protein [Streptosporangiaceae bacterium]|nr:lanthionine synthetase C family protein [Streptosporangiaceae bacterium]
MGWNPLLTGALRESALERAAALRRSVITARTADQRSSSLAAGSAGIAVCHAFAAQGGQDGRAGEMAAACLNSAVEALASQPLGLSLYSGFTGIAWAADLVDRLLPGQDADRNEDIDRALARAIGRYPADGPYDVIDGLAGLGSYALARWPRPEAADCLAGVVEHMAGRSRRDADGVYWPIPAAGLTGPRRRLYPAGGVDVGMAHGMAGVLPLLARACALGVSEPTARPLLDGAVQWLLAHLADSPAGRTAPSFVTEDGVPAPARSAWCYGDPGVAVALLLAARDVGEPGWAHAATELALRAARRPAELSGVTDAGLCHGAAGLAHLFTRMHQLTGQPELAGAARRWMERTLDMCARPAAWNGPGLLEGAAGIALVLLAGCLPAEPAWDQMLLVSTGLSAPVGA